MELDHIGFVVSDLEEASKELSELLGPPFKEFSLPEVHLKAVCFDCGGIVLEIISFEKTPDGVSEEVSTPASSVHHLAFKVKDFENTREKLASRGFKELYGFPRKGLKGSRITFLKGKLGVLYELVEAE